MGRVLFMVLAVLMAIQPAHAATTYYVATTGNDTTGNGTSGNPWRNPQKCVGIVVAGDTCVVRDGTYTDHDGDGLVLYLATVKGAHSGTAGNPITFKAENLRGAKLLMPVANGATSFGVRIRVDYQVIEGFEITDGNIPTTQGASEGYSAVNFGQGPPPIGSVIRRNYIHHIGRNVCSDSVIGNTAFAGSSTDTVIEYNEIHSIGRKRNGESGCVTTLYQNDHGFYAGNNTNVTFHHNLFYDNGRGYDIQVFKSGGQTSNGVFIYNNTFSKPTQTGNQPFGCVVLAYTNNNIQIKNNIFNNCPSGAAVFWFLAATQTNVVISHNLSDSADADMQNSSGKPASGVTDSNNTVGSASIGFKSVGSNDYTLTASSVAIGTGTNLGYACNAGCDKGAFQTFNFSSCEVPNSSPNTIQVTFTSNLNLLGTTLTTFTARRNGTGNALTGAASKIGDTIISLPVTTTYAAGDTVDISWASGGFSDGAMIGGVRNQPFIQTLSNQSCTNNAGGVPSYTLDVLNFRFKGVYGSETSTDWRGAENISNINVVKDGAVRIRMAVKNSVSDAPPFGMLLYYKRNGGAATVVPSNFGADGIAMCGDSYADLGVTNGSVTTNQLSTSGTFVPGAVILNSAAVPTITGLNVGYKTEPEYCVRWGSTASGTFALILHEQNGTAVGTTAVPTVTIVPSEANGG